MREAVLQALKIRPAELAKASLMATYLLLAVATFITGRIARDALFLSAFSKDQLAYMYISVAVMVPLPAYLYARIADRFRRDHLILVSLGLTMLGLVVIRCLMEAHARWVVVVLYNFTEMFGVFLVLQFWTYAGDMYSSREAKRLFPLIGVGGVVASVICGVGVSFLVHAIGTENLFIPQLIFLACCALIIRRVGTMDRGRQSIARAQPVRRRAGTTRFDVKNQVENVFQSKHLKIIAAMTVATFITVPLVDYQFKVLAKEAFTHDGTVDTDALSAFMGVFTTVTGLIALVMQLGLTSRILERFGVAVSLLVLPVTLLVGVLGMIFNIGSAFHNAVLGKGAENAFRYSIYDGTMQVIYAPVPNHMRGRAKTFVDGILKPAAGGIAGAAMVAIVGPLRLPVMSLAVFALALIVAWIGLILLIRREYVNELLATLRRRRLDFSAKLVIEDDATVAVLRRTLRSAEPAEVGHALELARRVRGHDLTQEAVALLTHPAPDLRRRAIELLATSGAAAPAERVLAHFTDPSEEVQAAAVRTYCLLTGGQGVRAVTGMLESVSPEVRGAAVAGLIKSGGLEGVLIAAEHLKAMQAATDERVRFAAACVLNEIAVRSYFQPVLTLLRDPSVRVQIAAIQAAGEMRAPELVPALVYKLAQRETARASALALAAYGATIVETLGKVLAQERESAALRRQVPRILERTATQRALEILLQCIGTTDGETRREIARAAGRLRDTLGVVVDEAPTRKVLTDELFEHYQSLAALDDLRPITGQGAPDLLRDALEERLKRSLERIFRLLSILYPLKAIDLVHANLRSATSTTRANAIEVLDNLLDQDDKRRILPLVEDQGAARVLAAGADLFAIQRRAPAEWVHLFLDGTDTWLVVAALHAAAELGLREGRASAERLYGHREPIVRETAVRTLAVLCDAREFLVLIERNADEEDPMVRAAIAFYADAARRVLGKAPNVAGRVRAGAGEFSVEST